MSYSKLVTQLFFKSIGGCDGGADGGSNVAPWSAAPRHRCSRPHQRQPHPPPKWDLK